MTIHHSQRVDQLVKVTIIRTIFLEVEAQSSLDGSRKHGVEIHEGSIQNFKIRKEKKNGSRCCYFRNCFHDNDVAHWKYQVCLEGRLAELQRKKGRSSAKTALFPFCHIIWKSPPRSHLKTYFFSIAKYVVVSSVTNLWMDIFGFFHTKLYEDKNLSNHNRSLPFLAFHLTQLYEGKNMSNRYRSLLNLTPLFSFFL